mgnify:CR=1 FL=1
MKKGERSSALVNDYALMLMENGQSKAGEQVVSDYFNSLSPKKRMKPENFFLYTRYAFNLQDPKARYLFEHKDGFVRANGKEPVEQLLYKWLRFELIPYMTLRSGQSVTAEGFRHVKDWIARVNMTKTGSIADFVAIAEMRLNGNRRDYLEI